jgi:DNA-binding MarR family transcriptional regulator
MQLSDEKAYKIAQQNAVLKAELRAARRKIRALQQEVGRSGNVRLDRDELDLLARIAECEIDDGFAVTFAGDLHLAPAKLDYHLQRLVDGGYIELLFTDSALGDNFSVTQKGRYALVKKHLL